MNCCIEKLCVERGLKMTEQRRVISRVLSESCDHPDVEEIHRRSASIDPKISIATVYRTMRLLENARVIDKLDLRDGRARYEANRADRHHHLIDLKTGEVIEFNCDELELVKAKIARELGYDIISDRLELYGVKKESNSLTQTLEAFKRHDVP
ncbi:MAG: Fur family transcriptional regulator [Alphaproteobacteria bacterium]|nr:Fur family transcriptional regulator [Alphaproteobacteria bacterium]